MSTPYYISLNKIKSLVLIILFNFSFKFLNKVNFETSGNFLIKANKSFRTMSGKIKLSFCKFRFEFKKSLRNSNKKLQKLIRTYS